MTITGKRQARVTETFSIRSHKRRIVDNNTKGQEEVISIVDRKKLKKKATVDENVEEDLQKPCEIINFILEAKQEDERVDVAIDDEEEILGDLPDIPAFKRFAHLLPGLLDEDDDEPECDTFESSIVDESSFKSNNITDTSLLSLPAIPAYQRFSHLISEPRTLPFPEKFKLLDRILGAIDSICMVAASRDQPVIWHKILRPLEASLGKRVETKHLQQICGLFRDDPLFTMRKVKIIVNGRRVDSLALEFPGRATHEYLSNRRTSLQQKLFAIVSDAHSEFLKSVGFKTSGSRILRAWHPKFALEDVSDPKCYELFPDDNSQDKLIVSKEIKKAVVVIDTVSSSEIKSDESNEHCNVIIKDATRIEEKSSSKDKLSLLERIRQKQREAEFSKITSDPVKEAQMTTFETLLNFIDTVAMLFSTSNKGSMLMGDVVIKVSQGSKVPISDDEVVSRIESLAELVPAWLKIVDSRHVKILKIDKKISLVFVRDVIYQKIKLL